MKQAPVEREESCYVYPECHINCITNHRGNTRFVPELLYIKVHVYDQIDKSVLPTSGEGGVLPIRPPLTSNLPIHFALI